MRTALEMLFEVHGLPAVSRRLARRGAAPAGHRGRRRGGAGHELHPGATPTGDEGVALFRAIRELDPDMPVLLMTAWTSLETAVTLVKEGAADYIAKPWDDDKLVRTVRNLLSACARCARRTPRLRAQGDSRARGRWRAQHDLCGLVYASPPMHEVVRARRQRRAARTCRC